MLMQFRFLFCFMLHNRIRFIKFSCLGFGPRFVLFFNVATILIFYTTMQYATVFWMQMGLMNENETIKKKSDAQVERISYVLLFLVEVYFVVYLSLTKPKMNERWRLNMIQVPIHNFEIMYKFSIEGKLDKYLL